MKFQNVTFIIFYFTWICDIHVSQIILFCPITADFNPKAIHLDFLWSTKCHWSGFVE